MEATNVSKTRIEVLERNIRYPSTTKRGICLGAGRGVEPPSFRRFPRFIVILHCQVIRSTRTTLYHFIKIRYF